MSKRTIRATIPVNHIEKYVELVKKVWEKHTSLGASSPFHANPHVDMARFEELMTAALQKREEALKMHSDAEALMAESRKMMGLGKGQTIDTLGTLYFLLALIRGFLLVKHRTEEKHLVGWGFHLVEGYASVGRKKKKE
jgi:hypothetical protein